MTMKQRCCKTTISTLFPSFGRTAAATGDPVAASIHSFSAIEQTGPTDPADVEQELGWVWNASSSIVQAGADNTAHVEQRSFSGDQTSEIVVNGSGNQFEVLQGDPLAELMINSSSIEAVGNENRMSVRQTGYVGQNASGIIATGDDNMIQIDQDARLTSNAGSLPLNTSELAVDGGSNLITLAQSVATAGDNFDKNTSVIHTAGNGNTVTVMQQQ